MSAPTVDCEIHPSGTLAILNLLLHGAALAGAWLAAFDVYFTWAMSVAVVVSLVYSLYNTVMLREGQAVLGIRYPVSEREGQWYLRLRSGQTVIARMDRPALVTPFLVAISFKDEAGSAHSVPLFRDATDSNQHRRLRTLLRMSADTFGPRQK